MSSSKKILLCVTGSIAAYKSVFLLRLLLKNDYDVKVVMTQSATEFVKPLSFSAFLEDPVYTGLTDEAGDWTEHVKLALWADLILIAPITAQTISKLANGACDNLLSAIYLSAKCPVAIAPAMDRDMWKHAAVKRNLDLLKKDGVLEIPVGSGALASGLEGEGRMAEPELIHEWLENYFQKKTELKNKKVLITAGPTREPLDPVRFISNHSSGKMGYALAEAMANNGAEVFLVSGPVSIQTNYPNIKVISIETAQEMFDACHKLFSDTDIAIMSAAVSDYKPENKEESKIKKKSERLSVTFEKNPDILASLGKQKKKHQMLVGFALETDNEIENARQKLKSKNCDFIILNSLKDEGAGFQHDTNKVTLIDKNNNVNKFELKSKVELSKDLTEYLIQEYKSSFKTDDSK
ncbi:MAG: bifunctional phosphopantothenoylcysteine decarboxylase/phosphopantothenate--cysteine ligase CoaBC [Chitinophagaceae bacterium]|nr:MAG: bifunctional phosphopantothenoylcysteine decarboxylase/phosphopantothenate--cysteine ligase CoaBC [Chitinophagaceae bacterium]